MSNTAIAIDPPRYASEVDDEYPYLWRDARVLQSDAAVSAVVR